MDFFSYLVFMLAGIALGGISGSAILQWWWRKDGCIAPEGTPDVEAVADYWQESINGRSS